MSEATNALASIPLGQVIGAPLNAIIEAQAYAAQTTVQFIESVGFANSASGSSGSGATTELGPTRVVNFTYTKRLQPNQVGASGSSGSGTTGSELVDVSMQVPLLAIVPIPYIRVDYANISFQAKITSQSTSNSSSSLSNTDTVSGGYSSWWSPWSVSFNATVTAQTSSATSSQFNESYDLNIYVHAVQDTMPAGLAKILQMMQEAIVDTNTVPSSGSK